MPRNVPALWAPLLIGALLAPARPLPAQDPGARVDSLFAAWAAPTSPGAAVAVLKNGEIVLERGYGLAQIEHGAPITPATVFHVASVTKQFTAFAVALLESRGQLSLDDDVRNHIPDLPDLGARITLRHLVHHTSGLRDQWELLALAGWRLDDVITKDHVLSLARRQKELNFEPGAEYLYSNMGYTLLAEVVERVGGRPFPEWMEENVFEPLGMSSTHMHDDHERMVPGRAYSYRGSAERGWQNAVLSYANAGATSLFTTAGDLARWLASLESGALGGPDVVARVRERGVLNGGDTIPYAFALIRGEHNGRTTWSHGGADAGFRTVVLHIPEERLGVVVLGNAASFNPGALASRVAEIYLGQDSTDTTGPTPTPQAPPRPDDGPRPVLTREGLRELEGIYYAPELEAVYRIVAAGDSLFARHVRHGDIALTPAERDVFSGARWFMARVAFERDPGGSVTGFRVTGNRVRNLAFVRLRDGALPD
jgi:CubicO group peptidase (beta-lactamase class C family)